MACGLAWQIVLPGHPFPSNNNNIFLHQKSLAFFISFTNWFPATQESVQQYKARTSSELYNRWIDKVLHGQFLRDAVSLVDSNYQWKWLQHGGISKEVEAFLFAAQEQALPTNTIKNKIYGQTDISPLCRLCGH